MEQQGGHSEGRLQVQGYCTHCREFRAMLGAIQTSNRRGGADLKGQCAVCGKPMYRIGGWDTLFKETPNAVSVE